MQSIHLWLLLVLSFCKFEIFDLLITLWTCKFEIIDLLKTLSLSNDTWLVYKVNSALHDLLDCILKNIFVVEID